MKKMYVALFGLLVLFTFGSCKKEAIQVAPHVDVPESQAEVAALGLQLEDFSNEFVPREETELRGFWSALRKFIYVVGSASVPKELKGEIALFTSVASNSAVLWEEK